jgi:hypothetical protein
MDFTPKPALTSREREKEVKEATKEKEKESKKNLKLSMHFISSSILLDP